MMGSIRWSPVLGVVALAVQFAACSSTTKNDIIVDPEGGAGGTGVGGVIEPGGGNATEGGDPAAGGRSDGDAGAPGVGGAGESGGGVAEPGGTPGGAVGGQGATGTGGGSAGTAGSGAASTTGGHGGEPLGSGGDAHGGVAGAAGAGGSEYVPMHCASGEAFCVCDDTGCFVDRGGPCARDSECASNACVATQPGERVCCDRACAADEVCLPDGTDCEAAATCDDGNERCSLGGFERCSAGQWAEVEDCGTRGCDVNQGGCLLEAGASCAEDSQCDEGICALTRDGSRVCCTASCGSCQVCDALGTGCTDPDTVPAGCVCTGSDPSSCDDALACTEDVCNAGACSNDVVSGYCLIGGQCVSHNAKDPSNPCRYCDATLNQRGWTNAGSSTSCNDGLYCNGADTCDGSGVCQHEYDGNRCTGTGTCDLSICDETRDSCYQPNTVPCGSRTEQGCSSSACGGDPQTRTVTLYCSGNSSACDREVPGNWQTTADCGDGYACNAQSQSCEARLGCGTSWCDPGTGLCWTLSEPNPGTTLNHAAAVAYCNNLVLANRSDWQLPTIQQWLTLARGCDGTTGTTMTESFHSTCTYNPSTNTVSSCQTCTSEGPTPPGCYWPSGMGACTMGFYGYWSSTPSGNGADYFWYWIPWNSAAGDGTLDSVVRCVVSQ